MDTTEWFIRDFLVEQVGCSETALQPANAPLQASTLYQLAYCGLGIETMNMDAIKSIFPNPSSDRMTIELNDASNVEQIELIDLAGRTQRLNIPISSSTIMYVENNNFNRSSSPSSFNN